MSNNLATVSSIVKPGVPNSALEEALLAPPPPPKLPEATCDRCGCVFSYKIERDLLFLDRQWYSLSCPQKGCTNRVTVNAPFLW